MPLANYFKILAGKQKAKYLQNKKELKALAKEAHEELNHCNLCENKCAVNRLIGKKGICGVGATPRIFSSGPHYGEEQELVPSGTVFFSGCTMKCVYCQNAPDSCDPRKGVTWTPEKFSKWMSEMKNKGCKNINLVGGDPTPNIPFIIETLLKAKTNIPIVFNSNGYYSEVAEKFLKKFVDVYLIDFRYYDDNCAKHLSGAENYSSVLKRNLLAADKNGELMIRVLVMPGHMECDAKPILKWIKNNMKNYRLNLMNQYQPPFPMRHRNNASASLTAWKTPDYPELSRKLTIAEYQDVMKYAREIGLEV